MSLPVTHYKKTDGEIPHHPKFETLLRRETYASVSRQKGEVLLDNSGVLRVTASLVTVTLSFFKRHLHGPQAQA